MDMQVLHDNDKSKRENFTRSSAGLYSLLYIYIRTDGHFDHDGSKVDEKSGP